MADLEGHGQQEAGVLAKLAAREAARQAHKAQREEDVRGSALPGESTAAFQQSFQQQKQAVEAAITAISDRGAVPSTDAEVVRAQLDDLALQVSHLEKAAAEASYFLPTYDQRQIAAATATFRDSIDSVKASVLPRKKFSFAKRTGAKAAAPAPSASDTASSAAVVDNGSGASATLAGSSNGPLRDSDAVPASQDPGLPVSEAAMPLFAPGRGLQGLRGTTITVGAAELQDQDFTLVDLEGCTVFLLGRMSALRMHRLRGCCVCTGPVTGAAFVEDLRDCTLMLAAFQVRIHRAHACAIYLRVRSSPIIEHSDGLGFAPYAFSHPGLLPLLDSHGLAEENGLWADVKDFGWLRAMQSPNWRLLPETEWQLPPIPANIDTV